MRDFSESWDFLVIWVFLNIWDASCVFDCVFAAFETDFFDVSRVDRDWIDFFSNCFVISFDIFFFSVFSNCWKFSNIVSQYDVFSFDFFVKLIDANSKFFFVYVRLMMIDASFINSRFTLARSIWLINCCTITCSIFATLRFFYKVFCAFFNVSSTESINVRILIESTFLLSAIWRFSFFLLFRLISASSFWLDVDRSIVFVSLTEFINSFWLSFWFEQTSTMLCSICWLTWSWLNSFVSVWFELDWFKSDCSKLEWFVIIWFKLNWSEQRMSRWDELCSFCWDMLVSLFMLNNFFSKFLLISSNNLFWNVLSNVIASK